jgi:hypothetical protein
MRLVNSSLSLTFKEVHVRLALASRALHRLARRTLHRLVGASKDQAP